MPEIANPKLRRSLNPPQPVPTAEAYAELDVTSNFSFLRGASHPDELVFRAAELGYRAIALTDRNSLAGVVRAHDAVKQIVAQGGTPPKLIIGSHLTLSDGPDILVYPIDRAAYGRLCRLLTLGRRRAEKGQCLLHLHDVLDHNDGLLAAVAQDPNGIARSDLLRLRQAFGPRLSLAASFLYGEDDGAHFNALLRLSKDCRVPLLATNAAHYHDPSRRALQDVLTCIRHGCAIHQAGFKLFPNAERYLKSPAQMQRLFQQIPHALHQALDYTEQCQFNLDSLKYEYPDEIVPPGMDAMEYLTQLTWAGAAQRYPGNIPGKVRSTLEHELALIEQLGFAPYFLTVHDLVTFARSRGILCQGRGSAANSAVCYCLGVTSVDPARIDLLFERFVSAARNEPPDIDIDFEHERREEVLQYIYEKYGRDRAGMTGVVITYRGRSAVRDVGKAMGLSLDLVDTLAKKLDWWERGTIPDQRLRECGLDPADPTLRRVLELTAQILGFPRHLSQHTGGMVITRGPLCELVPIENAAMDNRTVIEWDKDDIDTLGILKVDCLGLGMLTCISKALRMVNERHEGKEDHGQCRVRTADHCEVRSTVRTLHCSPSPCFPLSLHTIPPEDPAVYDMICNADTVGVFQIESRAQMSMLPRLRPRCFYDLVIEVAIVRPGPIQGNMVHPYLRRRNGEEKVEYPSPALEQVLGKTLGIPLFQEQAMRVAMVGAGFSAAEADQLRRAMAAWRKAGAIEKFHQRILSGMLANGYTAEFAEQCFLQIRGFGEYGFPESHAASFALLVYSSAWLKRHHPAAFCAALLNSQPMGFYAPAQIVRDAREHGVEVRPVDINTSDWDCTLEEGFRVQDSGFRTDRQWGAGGPAVRLGFRMIKGFRESDAQTIVAAREKGKRFVSIEQFRRRTALRVAVLRQLAEADAFTSLSLSRRAALWQIMELKDDDTPLFDEPVSSIQQPVNNDPCNSEPPLSPSPHLPLSPSSPLPPMPLSQEVFTDYRSTGLSLKRHPVSLVRPQLRAMKILCCADLAVLPAGRRVKVAGLVLVRQRPATANGIVFQTLEDETGIANLILRPHVYDLYRAAARHAGLLAADGYIERQDQVIHLLVLRLHDLSSLLAEQPFTSRDFH